MPEKVTKKEKLIELAIAKAKEVKTLLQEEGRDSLPNEEPLVGETMEVKRPNKNPKEENIENPVDKDTGYGLGGQVNKMKEIHTILKMIIKEQTELSPEITSNEVHPSQEKEYRMPAVKYSKRRLSAIEKEMDMLLDRFDRKEITAEEYIKEFSPLLASMKKELSYGSKVKLN